LSATIRCRSKPVIAIRQYAVVSKNVERSLNINRSSINVVVLALPDEHGSWALQVTCRQSDRRTSFVSYGETKAFCKTFFLNKPPCIHDVSMLLQSAVDFIVHGPCQNETLLPQLAVVTCVDRVLGNLGTRICSRWRRNRYAAMTTVRRISSDISSAVGPAFLRCESTSPPASTQSMKTHVAHRRIKIEHVYRPYLTAWRLFFASLVYVCTLPCRTVEVLWQSTPV
jgi:hypothetical protein